MAQPFPTHYCAAAGAASRIDRFLRFKVTASVLGDPVKPHREKLSDHAPVCFDFAGVPQRLAAERAIPRVVTAS
eukprot:4138652-Lingulodinium_polyedra.AAC.1